MTTQSYWINNSYKLTQIGEFKMGGKLQLFVPINAQLIINEPQQVKYGSFGNARTVETVEAEFYLKSAREVLNENLLFERQIRASLHKNVVLGYVQRLVKGKAKDGINAHSVNMAIRKQLSTIPNLNFETDIRNECFVTVNDAGNFDFTYYDKEINFKKMWNCLCSHSSPRNSQELLPLFLCNETFKNEWEIFLSTHSNETETLLSEKRLFNIPSRSFSVAGEIQFGNWGLIYKDMFRLLSAVNKGANLDLYVYIVATDTLNSLISDQTVEYRKALKEFKTHTLNGNIPSNIWIIPVDIKISEEALNEACSEYINIINYIENEKKKIKRQKSQIDILYLQIKQNSTSSEIKILKEKFKKNKAKHMKTKADLYEYIRQHSILDDNDEDSE